MKITKHLLTTVLLGSTMLVNSVMAGDNHSIESLERERASMINLITDGKLAPNSRNKHIKSYFRRLTDIERMVLRDDRLQGNPDAIVQRAFSNYDLTFMVHASVEAKRDITDHWLAEVGLSTRSVLSTTAGRR